VPVLTIFAGPNGSGKSSIIGRVDFVGRDHLLEADAIAGRIHAGHPRLAAITAGREVLRRTQEYLRSGQDFAIETTLSGSWTTSAVKQALARRFFVRLVYICLNNPEQCIRRVQERVAQGGHDVPNADVRRRYSRSLSNLKQLVNVANEALIYDNSGPEPMLILEIRSGHVVGKSGDLPRWVHNLLEGARP
jgi:predicted ABC-type ATPase